MTAAALSNDFTRDRLRRLVAMVRSQPAEETSTAELAVFDWTRPHHFRPEHLAMLDTFRRKTIDAMISAFQTLCHGTFSITAQPVEQYYASMLASNVTANQENDYFLVLSTPDENHCGFVNFNMDAACRLVAMMLHETRYTPSPERRLSALEEGILMDIAAAVVDSFTEILRRFGGSACIKDKAFVKGAWPLNFEGFNDLTCLPYRLEYAQGSLDLTFTLLSPVLEPAAGFEVRNRRQSASEELVEAMMRNMHKAPIRVTARLCSAAIDLDHVMNLSPGDVLVLPRKTSEPMEILLNDMKTFSAFGATFGGKYAAVISPPESE